MKWNVPSGSEQELERAGVLVADRAARALGRRLHLLARVGIERRRGRLLDELLVPPLDRAFALAEREHAAVLVAEHLDLDVARGDKRLLEVERPVREGRLGLGARGRVRGLELVGPVHEPHALAAAAGDRLQQDREAELGRGGSHLRQRGATLGARARAARRPPSSPPWRAPCRPSAPSRPRPARRRRDRSSSHARTKAGFSERKP